MNWSITFIAGLALSVVISASLFIEAVLYATKKRSHRFGVVKAIALGFCGFLSIFINPFPNIYISTRIDEYRLDSLIEKYRNRPVDELIQQLGKPDASSTNEYGESYTWHFTSPFFSLYPQDTIAFANNDIITSMGNDD